MGRLLVGRLGVGVGVAAQRLWKTHTQLVQIAGAVSSVADVSSLRGLGIFTPVSAAHPCLSKPANRRKAQFLRRVYYFKWRSVTSFVIEFDDAIALRMRGVCYPVVELGASPRSLTTGRNLPSFLERWAPPKRNRHLASWILKVLSTLEFLIICNAELGKCSLCPLEWGLNFWLCAHLGTVLRKHFSPLCWSWLPGV